MGKRRKRRGNFCWSCRRYLPNERFSGGGHARHLCRRCSKLGEEELRYRQATLDMDRMLDRGGGRIRRRDRKLFDRFLSHKEPRVRRYAEEISSLLEMERQANRKALEVSELRTELAIQPDGSPLEGTLGETEYGPEADHDDDLPF